MKYEIGKNNNNSVSQIWANLFWIHKISVPSSKPKREREREKERKTETETETERERCRLSYIETMMVRNPTSLFTATPKGAETDLTKTLAVT